jgi:tetratricopeptide (TPR) repeat protein
MKWPPIASGLLLALAGVNAGAVDYWAYQYKEFDVVAAGSRQYAATLARNLDALDEALTVLLNLDKNRSHTKTYINALPVARIEELSDRWKGLSAQFMAGPFGNIIVSRNTESGGNDYSGAYFGYVAGLMRDLGHRRYPDWYQRGVASVFSAASVKQFALTTGEMRSNYGITLVRGPVFPMRQFLSLPASDSIFNKTPIAMQIYQSQCWFFMHLVLLDRTFQSETLEYLRRMSTGENQEAAYLASFKMSYEQLDKQFAAALRKATVTAYTVSMLDISDKVLVRKLSDAEVNARLAELAITAARNTTVAEKYARAALQLDPSNETAALALVDVMIAKHQEAEAGPLLDALDARTNLSQEAHVRLGMQFMRQSTLFMESDNSPSSLLTQHAVGQFRQAVQMKPNDLGSITALSLTALQVNDKVTARDMLPVAEAALEQNPDNANMAGSAGRLNLVLGNVRDAFRLFVTEERLAESALQKSTARGRQQQLLPLLESAP